MATPTELMTMQTQEVSSAVFPATSERILHKYVCICTSVWIMLMRREQRVFTQLQMSTTPSHSAMSSITSSTIQQPVLPAPTLKRKHTRCLSETMTQDSVFFVFELNIKLVESHYSPVQPTITDISIKVPCNNNHSKQ